LANFAFSVLISKQERNAEGGKAFLKGIG